LGGQLDFKVIPTHFAVMHSHRTVGDKKIFFGGTNICQNIYHSPEYDQFSWQFHMQIAY